MTVDEFLDLGWRSVEPFFRVELMEHGGHRFKVRHVPIDPEKPMNGHVNMGYMDDVFVGSADNMERTVRLLYAHWIRTVR